METISVTDLVARLSGPTTKNNLVRFFADSDLRCGHKGLEEIARRSGIYLSDLSRGEFLLFTNKALTSAKYLGRDGVLAFVKLGKTQLTPKQIVSMPHSFYGPSFAVSKNTAKTFKILFPDWFKKSRKAA